MKRIALTFDDGPSDWTPEILRLLGEHDARATFFVLGEWVARRPALTREIAEAGHDLGNHTFTHADLPDLDDDAIEDELARTSAAIAAATGNGPRLFRAPAFRKDARVLDVVARVGLVDVGCSVNPEDWRAERTADAIVDSVLAGAQPRAIVDLHDGFPPYWSQARRDCGPTVEAVRRLVPELQRQGYELVTVTELLSAVPAEPD
ncbi:MAG: polysaccharide deacetylase family protein [Actinomycetota bacterium]|nr:polysaccharide deacetylase family protein [Actinomycetota bacterium]